MTEPVADVVDVVPHYCTGCGQMHGGEARENPEVAIARIQAERDVKVAQLSRTETTTWAEADVATAEIAAEAQVDEAVVTAEVQGEMLDQILEPEPEPEPVVVVSNEAEGGGADEMPAGEPPEAEPAEAVSSKPSNPWWG